MKMANEMKELSSKNDKIVNYLEKKIAPLIENTAQQGQNLLKIKTDKFPSEHSRSSIVDKVTEYMSAFGYHISCSCDYKHIIIQW